MMTFIDVDSQIDILQSVPSAMNWMSRSEFSSLPQRIDAKHSMLRKTCRTTWNQTFN